MTLTDLQHFKYAGGGYFRDARVPKGKTAPVLHGSEIIEVIQKHLNRPSGNYEVIPPNGNDQACVDAQCP